MNTLKPFIFFILLSVGLHFLVLASFSPQIDAKGQPVVYCWPSILNKEDLFTERRQVVLPQGVPFSLDYLSKRYFLSPLTFFKLKYSLKDERFYPSLALEHKTKEQTEHLYLWEVPTFVFSERQENVSYKALMADDGRAIVSYPEKLPVDSSDNILIQEQLRESSFSIGDKFFWTKLEGVLK